MNDKADQPETEHRAKDRPRIDSDPSAGEALRDVVKSLTELRDYFTYFLSAQADRFKVSVRNELLGWGGVLIAMAAGAALVVVGIAMLCTGLSGAIGDLVGRPWTGHIIVGGVMTGLAAIGLWTGASKINQNWRDTMVNKYERRKKQQRQRYGRDLQQRAESQKRDA